MRISATCLMAAAFCGLLASCSGDHRAIGGSGLLEATETVVSSEATGRVTQMLFDEGSLLAAGDTLLRLDASRLELELAAAEAGRSVIDAGLKTARLQRETALAAKEYARKERDRAVGLLASGTATARQMDQLEFEYSQASLASRTADANVVAFEAQLKKADADIARLTRNLSDCHPLAPIAGVVTDKYVETGELLSPGRPIAGIARLDTLWVKVYLPTESFASVKLGAEATVDTESGGQEYAGRVVWTSTEAEFTPKNVQTEQSRTNLVYAVKIEVPNVDGSLKIGMPVFVTLSNQ